MKCKTQIISINITQHINRNQYLITWWWTGTWLLTYGRGSQHHQLAIALYHPLLTRHWGCSLPRQPLAGARMQCGVGQLHTSTRFLLRIFPQHRSQDEFEQTSDLVPMTSYTPGPNSVLCSVEKHHPAPNKMYESITTRMQQKKKRKEKSSFLLQLSQY
jgi:hypothetical protein